MRVAISGLSGSGTTTVAKSLADKLGYKLVSAGEIFRRMANEQRMNLIQFSRKAEIDPEIDRRVDEIQKEISEKEDDIVIEGRLSARLVNADLRVWLKAPFEVRVERIAKREGRNYEEVFRETSEREKSEKMRYMKYYGIDIDDLSFYDLVIESSKWNSESIVNIIFLAVKEMVR
jgi:cytidylate kinase